MLSAEALAEQSASDSCAEADTGSSDAGGISRAGRVLTVGRPSKRGRASSGSGSAGKALPL